jgi:hypothetical protein
VAGSSVATLSAMLTALVDLALELVDLLVARDDAARAGRVPCDEGADGGYDLGVDGLPHRQDAALQVSQLGVELAAQVLVSFGVWGCIFHPYLPVT